MKVLDLRHVMIGLAVIALGAGSAIGQDTDELKDQLVTIEKSLWEAWKNKEGAPFLQHLHPDFVSVTESGSTAGRQAGVASVTSSTCDISSYSLSDWRLFALGNEAAMLLYSASQNVTCEGEKLPSRVRCSSVYIRRDGHWIVASYQETRMKD